MTIIETAKVTSKGQITIPSQVRKILHLEEGSNVVFALREDGIILLPCKVVIEAPYTPEEFKKIEKIIAEKGKIYKTPKKAKRHIKSL